MSDIITVAQLRAYRPPLSSTALDFSSWTDAQLQTIVDSVEEQIVQGCRQRFGAYDSTVYANGSGNNTLILPSSGIIDRVNSVSACVEVDEDDEVYTTYTPDTDFLVKPHYLKMRKSTASVRRYLQCAGVWPKGIANIKITGSFGFTPIPESVALAAKMWCVTQTLGPAQLGSTLAQADAGIVMESWPGDYTATYSAKGTSEVQRRGLMNISGFTDIDRLLTPYVSHTDLFSFTED